MGKGGVMKGWKGGGLKRKWRGEKFCYTDPPPAYITVLFLLVSFVGVQSVQLFLPGPYIAF